MNAVVKGSAALAVLVAIVSILVNVTGLHGNQAVGFLTILIFIGLNVGVVYWVLNQFARRTVTASNC